MHVRASALLLSWCLHVACGAATTDRGTSALEAEAATALELADGAKEDAAREVVFGIARAADPKRVRVVAQADPTVLATLSFPAAADCTPDRADRV